MIGAFNTAVTALQGFFSKLFWFGVFVPVALSAALHLGLAVLTFPDVRAAVAAAGAEDVRLVGAILGMIVLAFLLSPLLPLLRGLLDGALLPAWLFRRLVEARVGEARRHRAEIRATRDTAGAIQQIAKQGHEQARTAYSVGMRLPKADDTAATVAAEEAIAAARKSLERAELPGGAALQAAIAATDAALRMNNPDKAGLRRLNPAAAKEDLDLAERTGRAGDDLDTLLTDAEAEATGRFDAAKERLRGIPTDEAVQATRMGDARRAAERYAMDAYGVHFAFLRPRLLIHVPKDSSPIADRLTTAQAALDAAVMSVFLAGTLFIWLAVLAVHGQSVSVLLLVALGAPMLIWGCLRLAIEAQFGLGEAVNLAVDRHRFDVLKELRQPIPTSRWAERALWARISAAEADHRLAELPYMPPPPENGG